jgi:hypothetical protein
MRNEWYVCKYKAGVLLDKTPIAMTREEADHLCQLSRALYRGFTWQVKHRKDINK